MLSLWIEKYLDASILLWLLEQLHDESVICVLHVNVKDILQIFLIPLMAIILAQLN